MSVIKYQGGVISEGDQFTTADFDAPLTVSAIFSYAGKITVAVGFSDKSTLMPGSLFVEHVVSGFYIPSGTPRFIEGSRFIQASDETLVTVLDVSDRKERFTGSNGTTSEFVYFVRRYDPKGSVSFMAVKESYLAALTLVGATVPIELPTNPDLPGTIEIILEV